MGRAIPDEPASGAGRPESESMSVPITSGSRLPTTPMAPSTNSPGVTRPLYRLIYGSRPRRVFHAETRGGTGRFVATVCAAVLISGASKTYRAVGLRSEKARDAGPATG